MMLCRHWVNASWAKRPKGGAFLSPAVKRIAGRQRQSAGIDVRKAFIRHIHAGAPEEIACVCTICR